ITGTGFQAGENTSISVVGSNGFTQVLPGTTIADANGTFTTSFVVNPGFANTQMTITATGNLGDTAVTTCFDAGGELSIAGEKFYDSNQNGSPDPGEVGIGGWTIYLSTSPDFPTGVIASVTTDSTGNFVFTNDPTSLPGQVQVPSLSAFTQYYV